MPLPTRLSSETQLAWLPTPVTDSVVMTAKRRTGRYPALSGQHAGSLEITRGVHNEGKSVGVRY